jgi:regulator of PEP synthase PpsR (kinase-PPPase family)
VYQIFIVSDGTGRTAKQALDAALTQFGNAQVDIKTWSDVRSEEQVETIVQEAKKGAAFIVHTLVADSMRDKMINCGREHDVATIDLMGPFLARLSNQFSASPSEKPGLFSQLNKDYFRRIETMEFAFYHDDGKRVNDLYKAEIVLVGVSRTFKTPLSIYLAFKGWWVANVPIIFNVEPPPILFKLEPKVVFALNTSAHQLAEFRQARQNFLGEAVGSYADLEFVRMELMYARNIFSRRPEWPVISVVSKPIEEIASEILALKNMKGIKPDSIE